MYVRLSFVFGIIGAGLWIALRPSAWLFSILILLGLPILLCILGVAFLFLCSLFCYGKKPIEKDNAFCRLLSYLTMDSILALYRFRLRGVNLDALPKEPFVFVCNHVSRFDPMASFVLLPGKRLGFISKKENMQIPIVGPITSKIGFLALDRENPLKAMRTIHAGAKLVSEKGFIMGIYPEGKRNKDGNLTEFKTGAFVMAKKAKCPLVITSIKGTNLFRKNLPFRTTPVTFEVLDVIPPERVKELSPEALSAICYETIRQNLS